MKLGIVSCYFINNYGSVLQAYALQEYFIAGGIECETISVEGLRPYLKAKKRQYWLRNICKAGLFFSKLPMVRLKMLQKLNYRNLGSLYEKRVREFDNFRKNFVFSDESASSLKRLSELSVLYDTIVVGSDQLWRPDNIFPDYYTLSWVSDDIPKVSYATSFGVAEPDEYLKSSAGIFLNRFSAISVRESGGCDLVKKLTGRTPRMVCDPVFLLTKERWRAFADASLCPKQKYIFTYFLGEGKKCRRFAERLSEVTGLPLLGVIQNDAYVPSDEKTAYPIVSCSPKEFIGLLANAEYVCTDSFHAVAFSTIFNKNFFAFRRFRSQKYGTNSRIESFLKTAGLENRLISDSRKAHDLVLSAGKDIDYETVRQKLLPFIDASRDFIEKEIISGAKDNVQRKKDLASQPYEKHRRDRVFSEKSV